MRDIRPAPRRSLPTASGHSGEGVRFLEGFGSSAAEERKKRERKVLTAAVLIFAVLGTGFYYFRYHLPALVENSSLGLRSAVPASDLAGTAGGRLNFQEAVPDLVETVKLLSQFWGMTGGFSDLSGEMGNALAAWPKLIMEGKGEELITALRELRDNLEVFYGLNLGMERIGNLYLKGGGQIENRYWLEKSRSFLDAAINWLDSAEPRRLLVLFQNPSELRPAGGFVGAYAEVELNRGRVEKFEVRDINAADRESKLKIVPPRELQLISRRWRAADGNWFFDFADSARTILDLFEDGGRYAAVIGLSAGVIEDVLEITGPVELKERGMVLSAANFLEEIQREVQIAESSGSRNPKAILAEFAAALKEKLAFASEEDWQSLAGLSAEWLEKKEIQLYFRDLQMQRLFEEVGAAGRVFQSPAVWQGDYLAVVFANVGGGKSDRYVKQKINLQSQLNSDGSLYNHLVISRFHGGEKSSYPWYRLPNQGYLKVFVYPGSRLVYANGGRKIDIPLRSEYRQGYIENALVAEIEESRETHPEFPEIEFSTESGKTVFGTWLKTGLGEEREVVLDYSRRLPYPAAAGRSYEFVLERQSGMEGEYVLAISAPVGFRFRENGLPVFEYVSSNPPARLIINLSLEKI